MYNKHKERAACSVESVHYASSKRRWNNELVNKWKANSRGRSDEVAIYGTGMRRVISVKFPLAPSIGTEKLIFLRRY